MPPPRRRARPSPQRPRWSNRSARSNIARAVAIGRTTATSRAGHGRGKYRQVPLNADARHAIAAYLAVRRSSASTALFLGNRGAPLGPRGVADLVAQARATAP